MQIEAADSRRRSLSRDMDAARLEKLFAADRAHLPLGAETHFHIVVTSGEKDWEFPRILTSPPYRDSAHATHDANESQFVERFGPYEVAILECGRACPHSSLGGFGWPDDQPEPYRWWAPGGR